MTTNANQHPSAAQLTTTTSTTQQHTSKTDKATETDSTPTRSKPSHLCITIRRGGPASGRPDGALRAAASAHAWIGWSWGWCGC